jgi:AmiR/NasT family two-component response regulator
VKILFDQNLPRRLRKYLPRHEIYTTREMKWEQLRNGALMARAAEAGFEVLVTIDKQIEHQQNLAALAVAVVVVDGKSNALPALLSFTPFLRDLFASPLEQISLCRRRERRCAAVEAAAKVVAPVDLMFSPPAD